MLVRLRALCFHTAAPQYPETCTQFLSQYKICLRDKAAADQQKLDEWMYVNVPRLNVEDLKDVLDLYHSAHTQGCPLPSALATAFLREIEHRVSQDPLRKWALVSLAAGYQDMFTAAGLDLHAQLVALSQGPETEEDLMKEQLHQIAGRLAALTALTQSHKNVPQLAADNKLFFSVAERVLAPVLSPSVALGIDHFCDVLFSSIKLNWGSKQFRRNLELLVFSRLNLIKISQKTALAEIYKGRFFMDFQYMQNLYGKYTELLRNSLSALHPCDFTRIVSALSFPSRSPVYSSQQLTNLLEQLIAYPQWGQRRSPLENVIARHAFLSYFVIIGHTQEYSVLDQICKYMLDNAKYFPPDIILKCADDFVDAKYFNSDFWDLFIANPLRFALIPGSLGIWVRILRKLKHLQPSLYDHLQRLPEMKMAEGKLQETAEKMLQGTIEWRKNDNMRKVVAGFLKQERCEFSELTAEEFLVDFTIPSKKLAIDVCQPRSFVLPTLSPVARLRIKKEVLELQGWTYLPLPCFTDLGKITWKEKLLRAVHSDKTHL